MATWRDNLRPASFRGIPFFWKDVATEVGRKTARHDYPGLDETYIEDLGQAPRSFSLEAFVLGADYMTKRDALISALETAGPGELIHPTYGKVQVSHEGKARVSESTREGGMAQFSLTFVVAGLPTLPSVSVDTPAAVLTAATIADTTAQAEFAAAFGVDKAPAFVANGAIAQIRAGVAKLETLRTTIATAGSAITATMGTINNIAESADGLVRAPLELAATLYGAVQEVLALPDRIEATLAAYRSAIAFYSGSATIPRTTPSRIREANNQVALVNLVSTAAVVAAVRAAAISDYASVDEAVAVRYELVAALDVRLLVAGDELYDALVDLRTALVRDLASRGASLARIVRHTPAATLPALLLAHQLYGDATRADELIARNRLRHPGSVPGGQPLEVLSAD